MVNGDILLDLKRHFDTVNNNILLTKLEYFGFDCSSIAFFNSYPSNRQQQRYVIGIKTNNLGLQVNDTDLERSHRIGRKTQRSTKPRPILVKFVSYKVLAEVFRSKRDLKKTGLGITES